MPAEELLQWARAVPFQPFRIYLNSGTTYDIIHPKMIRVGRSIVYIFTYESEDSEFFERMEMVGVAIIDRIEPLAAVVQS